MAANAKIISLLTALVLIGSPLYASTAGKAKTKPEKTVQGTVVVATDTDLVIRKGKANVTLMYDSASQKPAKLQTGAAVLVHYRDEKKQHVATLVELTDGTPAAGKAPAK